MGKLLQEAQEIGNWLALLLLMKPSGEKRGGSLYLLVPGVGVAVGLVRRQESGWLVHSRLLVFLPDLQHVGTILGCPSRKDVI